jgi:hypothetical protein
MVSICTVTVPIAGGAIMIVKRVPPVAPDASAGIGPLPTRAAATCVAAALTGLLATIPEPPEAVDATASVPTAKPGASDPAAINPATLTTVLVGDADAVTGGAWPGVPAPSPAGTASTAGPAVATAACAAEPPETTPLTGVPGA